MLNVCVVGTGYVGLVTGSCLADLGHRVCCVDRDSTKIAMLREGRVPIFEPGLESIVVRNAAAGRLSFATDLGPCLAEETLVLFLAVGTPSGSDGASADLGPLFEAVQDAARARALACPDGFVVFAVKSTVPMGTCRSIEAIVGRHLPRDRFAVASNPEFLREGCAIEDFMEPDRIVVGSESAAGLSLMHRLYEPLTARGYRLLDIASLETSEMIKYASNVFLATKIGLINEFSRLCEKLGTDIEDLAAGIGLDRRIGPAGLRAGPGFGGSCFPKDLRALVGIAAASRSSMPIARAVILSNERQKRSMGEKIRRLFGGDLLGLRIAFLGLSFKAGTDDVREAPALSIIAELQESGAAVSAYDPEGARNAARLLPFVDYATSPEAAAYGAHAVVVATEWPIFRTLDWSRLRLAMARPLIVDLRNILDGADMADLGYEYVGLGRAAVAAPLPFVPERRLPQPASEPVPAIASIASEPWLAAGGAVAV